MYLTLRVGPCPGLQPRKSKGVKMRIAVSGVGKRSVKVLGYLKSAMPEAEIVGFVDPHPHQLATLCEPSVTQGFATVSDMLATTRPDLLFVGSPNHLHLDHITSGLKAGVQVFSEKPIVTTLEQTWALAELLREHGSDRLMVGLVLRYAPQMKDLQKTIAAGHLGKIVSLEANEHIEPQHGGFFMRDWRRYTAYSGGFMLEKCCHDLDLYHMITASRPTRVASFGGRRIFTPENAPSGNSMMELYHTTPSIWQSTDDPFHSDADIIDHQNAVLSFENGITMSFHTNLNAPDQSRHFSVIGTKGMAEGDLHRGYFRVTDAQTSTRLVDIDYNSDPDLQIDHYGADRQMTIELAGFLRGETAALPVSVVDAIEAGISAMALDEARTTGKIVDLADTWAKLDNYGLRHQVQAHAV